MTLLGLSKIRQSFRSARDWVANTPARAIEIAYQAAVNIKKIEDDYFKGKAIADTAGYPENTYSLFRIQLNNYLRIIDLRLIEYKLSARFNALPLNTIEVTPQVLGDPVLQPANPSLLQQLAFIDFILSRYRLQPRSQPEIKTAPITLLDSSSLDINSAQKSGRSLLFSTDQPTNKDEPKVVPIEKSVIPGSFLRALQRIGRNLTPSYFVYEREVVDELRQSRKRTNAAIQYVFVLILITVVTQQGSKNIIYSPLVNYWNQNGKIAISLNLEYEEAAINKFRLAKEKLEFERLIGGSIDTTEEMSDAQLRQEAMEIVQLYKEASLEGIKNLLADITASAVFYLMVVAGRRQLLILKEFIDETFYSLSDNAKAFLLIASTDIFVGYHSSDGWEALLTSLLRHFGLPENPTLILAFIATVPVFLDALFKFWIFQYLTRYSPATAVIYREMNE